MDRKWLAAGLAGLTLAAQVRTASACGCFAPPSPATPVVQAGERILFAKNGDVVTAHIQIQYQGSATDFGWLVPLPSVPTLELGSDELFTVLGGRTNPQYTMTTTRQFCDGTSTSSTGSAGCGSFFAADSSNNASPSFDGGVASDAGVINNPALVVQSSIGPYDYAVLKADDKQEMLDWLDANHYYVPDATGLAVAPYIHPGGYFLALKLRAGEAAGDIVPVVLHYKSDLPMIPITLTQVGATENMGVLVWLLGEARAIPRNYHHVELDEIPIWNSPLDYPKVAIRAVREAPERHAFLTEYAGTSTVMRNQLDYPGRFGNLQTLAGLTDPRDYLEYLRGNGYTFNGALFAVLHDYLPEPESLVSKGISEAQFYTNFYLYESQVSWGDVDAGAGLHFDSLALTAEIDARIIGPLRAAAKLFDEHNYLTRMFTALSPADMNLDPVFSENPDLPNVVSQHTATLTIPCRGDAWLRTENGREEQWISSLPPNLSLPAAIRIENLREEGPPVVLTDNEPTIVKALGIVDHGSMTGKESDPTSNDGGSGGCDCNIHHGIPPAQVGTLLLVGLAIHFARRRRRRQ